MDAAAPDARRASRRVHLSRTDRRQRGGLGDPPAARLARSRRRRRRDAGRIAPPHRRFPRARRLLPDPLHARAAERKNDHRHQPRGADPLLAADCVAKGRMAETGIRRRPRLALAAGRGQGFEKDQGRVLSAAATGDRSKLSAARGEAWSRRYGGGWPLVGTLLEASRNAAARARLRQRMGAATMAALTIGALGFAGVSWVEWGKADQNDRLERMFVDGVLDISKARSSDFIATTQVVVAQIRTIAEHGNDVAAKMMADIYYKGLGIAKDYDSAIAWYERAAKEHNVIAMRNIGDFYENGDGVPERSRESEGMVRKSRRRRRCNRHARSWCSL